MTRPRHVVFNTLERVLSSDFTIDVSLQHAALLALGTAVLQGDSGVYGVISGLTVSASGADLRVTVAPGLAVRLGTAATAYDSDVAWIQLTAAESIDLTSYVDGGNPRWVAIHVAEGLTAEAQEVREFFNTATAAVTASLADVRRTPDPVFTVSAGTAAATPVFPAGTSGVIPLAYVYLTAGALTINATDIVMCRPMLRSDGAEPWISDGSQDVWGGGVEIMTAGLDVVLRNAGGRFSGSRVNWSIGAADGTTAYTVTAQGTDGAALPVADDILYFYACPAPYPSGYDTELAPREHRPGATALTRYQGMVSADLYNAVLVVSTVAPQVNTQVGAPTAGDFTMTCAPFTAASLIRHDDAMYLGAAFRDVATQFEPQEYKGGGEFRWTQVGSTNLPTSTDVENGSSTGPTTGDSWLADPFAASGTQIVPSTANAVAVYIALTAVATATYAFDIVEDSGPAVCGDADTGAAFRREFFWLRTRAFDWSHSEGTGVNSTLVFTVRGFIDGVLALR